MNCSAQFPGKFDFGCVIQLLMKVKAVPNTGITMPLVAEALWLGGNIIAAIDPVGVTLEKELPFDDTEDSVYSSLVETDKLQSLADEGLKFFDIQDGVIPPQTIQALNDNSNSKDWTIALPLILEIIKMIIENRKKKQQTNAGPAVLSNIPTLQVSAVGPGKPPMIRKLES